jgi:hypothetical protein
MKTLVTAEAISQGGRSGFVQAPAWLMNIKLGNPLEPGTGRSGPNSKTLRGVTVGQLMVDPPAKLPVVLCRNTFAVTLAATRHK